MKGRFNEAKATQVAALLLKLRGTGQMSYLKLIKLMYLVDREALARWGRPVSTDRHVSMDKGPVLSRVYNLITEEQRAGGAWSEHISAAPNYTVKSLTDPGTDELSRAEEDLISEVFAQHGHKDRWTLVKDIHEFPEWQDPQGSMIPIRISEILEALGKSPAIEEEIQAEAFAGLVFESV
jgi:uncharacterized phage-associated protein